MELSAPKKYALRILGSRNLSSGELKKRLEGRGVDSATADETVRWLEDIGVVDDTAYASDIVKHYASKGYGVARIRDELYKRGIPGCLWEDALEGAEGNTDAARGFLEKKLRGSRDKDDLRRATDALRRRGFSYSDAADAVKSYLSVLEETEPS